MERLRGLEKRRQKRNRIVSSPPVRGRISPPSSILNAWLAAAIEHIVVVKKRKWSKIFINFFTNYFPLNLEKLSVFCQSGTKLRKHNAVGFKTMFAQISTI